MGAAHCSMLGVGASGCGLTLKVLWFQKFRVYVFSVEEFEWGVKGVYKQFS